MAAGKQGRERTCPPERRLQLTFIDTDDGLLAMLVRGSVARWEETWSTVEPVVAWVLITH